MLLARAPVVLERTVRVIAPDTGVAELARRLTPELERLLLLDASGPGAGQSGGSSSRR